MTRKQDAYYRYVEFVNPTFARVLELAGFAEVEDRAEGVYLWDSEGRKYLDFVGGFGTFNFGHRHPEIVGAVMTQMQKMPLSCKVFLNERMGELAEAIAGMIGEPLKYTFFGNSGTEGVECALKLARGQSPSRKKIISFHNAFHGKTQGSLSTTGREQYRRRFEPLLSDIVFVPYGDLVAVEHEIDDRTCAVIVEPVQGEGGVRPAPDGFIAQLREVTREHGAFLIVDEVQTGMGRTGRNLATEYDGIKPDLMVLGKALGGGILPMGACVGTEAAFAPLIEDPLAHTSTFGGNPIACAAGLASIRILQRDRLAERAYVLGNTFVGHLRDLASTFPDLIVEVRGKGLMIGIEFATSDACEFAILGLKSRGILSAFTLNNPKVLRVQPPLIVEEEHLTRFVEALSETMTEARSFLGALNGSPA
ncbi:MAG: aspartate aminotransferase family protein [bacterium JZ-2024 1]